MEEKARELPKEEKTGEVIERAESLGLTLEHRAGLLIARQPAPGGQTAEIDLIVRRLGKRINEVRRLVIERDRAAREREFLGRTVLIPGLLLVGMLKHGEADGRLGVECRKFYLGESKGAIVLSCRAEEALVIVGNDERGRDPLYDGTLRLSQQLGFDIRLWSDGNLMVVGWPDAGRNCADLVGLMLGAIQKLNDWHARREVHAVAGSQIPEAFIESLGSFWSWSKKQGEIAGRLLQLGTRLEDLRRLAPEAERERCRRAAAEFAGQRAYASTGVVVTLERYEGGEAFLCSDDIGETHSFSMQSLLILPARQQTEDAPPADSEPARPSLVDRIRGAFTGNAG